MSATENQPEREQDNARQAGRGGLGILAAKVFFIASGLVQQALLSRVIRLDGYGALARVQPFTNILNNVTVSASIQGVSRAVSSAGSENHGALRAALRAHVPIALFLGGAAALSAPWLAAWQGTASIETPLVIMALVLTVYGVYAPLVGGLNGRRKFLHQAALDITAATLRTIGLVGAGYLFVKRGHDGTLGTTVGAAIAATCVVPFALVFTKVLRAPSASDRSSIDTRAYVRGLLPLAFIQLGTNLLMQVDILTLGHFLSDAAKVSHSAPSAEIASNEWVGVYRGCQLFAFLPYQLLISLTQVLFPMVAKARAEGDREAVRKLVERGARIGVVAAGAMVSIIVALPGPVLSLLYPVELAERGAATLRVLGAGHGLFALMGIAMTVLASLGRERVGAYVSLGGATIATTLMYLWLGKTEFGERQLLVTAGCVAATLVVAFGISAFLVRREAGAFIPWTTAARVLFAAGAVCAVAHLMGTQVGSGLLARGLVLAKAVALVVVYVGSLIVTRELGPDDVAMVRALRKR